MGREGNQQTTPDLFSAVEVREISPASIKSGSDKATRVPSTSQRHVLPENLEHAVKQLTDDELTQLLEVALQEAKQRGKSPLCAGGDSMQSSRPKVRKNHRSTEKASKQVDAAAVSLSPGNMKAVRAAFKAGVTPVRIARQFGISQMNVRKALASDDRS